MELIETLAPTCEADGYELSRCQREGCEKTETTVLNALGHQMVLAETLAPTCEKDGYKLAKCQNEGCDKTETVILPAIGHDRVCTAAVKPTCELPGYEEWICGNCGDVVQVDHEAKGHSWALADEKAPTCTEEGYTVYRCDACGGTRKQGMAALGHQPESAAITVSATCTEAGRVYALCTACGDEVVLEVLPALGHIYTNQYVQAETQHRIYCLRDCGKYLTRHCAMKQVQLGGLMIHVCAECGRGEGIDGEQLISKTATTSIKNAKLEVLKNARVLMLHVEIQQFTADGKLTLKLLTIRLKDPDMAHKLEGLCRVSIPYTADTQGMKLVFITGDGQLVDVAYAFIDGELVFQTEALGTYAFIPVEEAA